MEIDNSVKGIAGIGLGAVALIAITVFLSILLWGFFLGMSGLDFSLLLTFDFSEIMGKLLSLEFILFLLAFPLTFALVVAFCRVYERTTVLAGSAIGTVLGITAAAVAFPVVMSYWGVMVFYIISIPVMISFSYVKFLELKKLVFVRTLNSSIARAVLIIAAGLFLMTAFTMLSEKDKYVEEFENSLFENIIGGEGMGIDVDLVEAPTDALIGAQKTTVSQIMDTPQYENLSDPEFKLMMDGFSTQLNSIEYRERVKEQLEQELANEQTLFEGGVDLKEMLREKVPLWTFIEEYLWIWVALILMSLFSLIGNVTARPLGMLYGFVLEKIISRFGKEK